MRPSAEPPPPASPPGAPYVELRAHTAFSFGEAACIRNPDEDLHRLKLIHLELRSRPLSPRRCEPSLAETEIERGPAASLNFPSFSPT